MQQSTPLSTESFNSNARSNNVCASQDGRSDHHSIVSCDHWSSEPLPECQTCLLPDLPGGANKGFKSDEYRSKTPLVAHYAMPADVCMCCPAAPKRAAERPCGGRAAHALVCMCQGRCYDATTQKWVRAWLLCTSICTHEGLCMRVGQAGVVSTAHLSSPSTGC